MQIVIDIPEKYKKILDNGDADGCIRKSILTAVTNGTVLEPHGRCIDVDAAIKKYGDSVAFLNGRVGGDYIIAPTILEATMEY